MDQARNSPARLREVGEQAPDFTLPDQDSNMVTLEEFRGKQNVVLVFYPGDSTPGCTKQLCAIRDDFDVFTARNTVVLGINSQGPASHRKFINRHRFPFRLLVDHAKEVVSAYGCKGAMTTKRTVYGIDQAGIIVFARRGRPSNEEILQAFQE